MNPWTESLGVLALAAGGVVIGAWFSRQRRPWWLLGYLLPLLAIVLSAAASREPALAFIPPISWIMAGRTKFAAIGVLGAIVLTTPLLKLPKRRDRVAVSTLMVFAVSATSVWPFLAPAFNHAYLGSLVTQIDADGVCRQSTTYTCGPAAAVTGLRQLGFPADEGQIAILAHTSSAIGTPADVLADALQHHYGPAGLECNYRVFKDSAELRGNLPALAIVKFNLILDHYVTVLDVTEDTVTVGDPLMGLTCLLRKDFEQEWRHTGVVLKRGRPAVKRTDSSH